MSRLIRLLTGVDESYERLHVDTHGGCAENGGQLRGSSPQAEVMTESREDVFVLLQSVQSTPASEKGWMVEVPH